MSDEEKLLDHPMASDQPEGTRHVEEPSYLMQVKQDGRWIPFLTPSTDRDKVTRTQAFHLNKDPHDVGLRVWKREVIWTLDEVPGHGEGQTPPEEIIARNDANSQQAASQD